MPHGSVPALAGHLAARLTLPVWFGCSDNKPTAGREAPCLGLFTRDFAVAIEMLITSILYWKNGFGWLNRGCTLLWVGLLRDRAARRRACSANRKIGVQPQFG